MNRFPPPPPGAERRQHARHDVVVSVEVAHDDTIAIASLTNISHGGAFLELDDCEAIAIGIRVRVQIEVGGHEATADGRVVRVTAGAQPGFAVTWTAPSASLAAIVDHLIAEVARAPAAATA